MKRLAASFVAKSPRAAQIALGLLGCAGATAVRALLTPYVATDIPWATYFLAVLVCAAVGGGLSAATALSASGVVGTYAFIPPGGLQSQPALVSVAVFFVVGASVAWVGVRFRSLLRTAQANERRLAVERDALGLANRQLETLTGAMAAPVTLCNRDLEYVWVSNAYAAWLQRPVHEIVGRRIADVLGPSAFERLRPYFDRVLRGEVVRYEDRAVFPGIGERWISATYTPVVNEQGGCDGWVAVVVDVDDRRRALERHTALAEELRADSKHWETLLQSAPVAIWIARDPECRVIEGNVFANRLLGVPGGNVSASAPVETRAVTYRHCRDGVDVPVDELPMQRCIRTRSPVEGAEVELVFPDGRRATVLVNAVPLLDDTGSPRGCLAAGIDVTERERALHELEKRDRELAAQRDELRAILDIAPIGIGISYDPKASDIRVNRRFAELLRIASDQNASLTGPERSALTFHCERDGVPIPGDELPMQAAARTGQPVRDARVDVVFEDGTVRKLIMDAAPFLRPDGTPRGCVASFADVTDILATQQALHESEARFRTMADATPIPIWVTNVQGEIQFINRAYREFFGVTEEEVQGPGGWQPLIHPEDSGYVEAYMTALREQRAFSGECRVRAADGMWRWIASRGSPRFSSTGEFLGHAGSSPDITDRKRMEEQLRESERRLRSVVEQLPVGLGVMDQHGRWVLTNPLMEAIVPRAIPSTLPDRVGRWRACDADGRGIPPEDWPGKRALRGDVVSPGLEMIFTDDDGRDRWMRVSASPLRDEAGRITGATCIVEHIDDEKRAADALARSEEQLALVSNTVPALISYVDTDCRYRLCNRAYTEWFGLTADGILGRTVGDVVGEAAWRVIRPHMQAALAGRVVEFEAESPYLHGGTRWVHAVYTPHRDVAGRVLGIVVMVSDVTARRTAEEALREADRRKDEFLAMLAHELRNPLAPIRNAVQVLRMLGPTDDRLTSARDMIDRQVTHMTHLVDDLLDVSRITQGKIELKRMPVALGEVVEEAVEGARSWISHRQHALSVELGPEPLVVYADRARLVQVVGNLLVNAAKFTPHGGHITVRTAATDRGEAVVRVSDTGIGIPHELHDAVFELFRQEETALARSQGGLGIGLTLVKRLVELHGGRVEVRSEGRGCGSEFAVVLPLGGAHPVRATPSARAAAVPGSSVRVLVVEDNPDAAQSFEMVLELYGHDVRVVRSGMEALRVLDDFAPQVAFVDIGLPEMDGFELARRLRADPRAASALLIALTGYGTEDDKTAAHRAGFDRHLVKPLDPAVVVAILSDIAGGNRSVELRPSNTSQRAGRGGA